MGATRRPTRLPTPLPRLSVDASAGDTSTADSTADSAPGVTFSGEGSDAFCALAEQFDSLETPTDGDAGAVETSWTALVAAMNDMADEAPAEISDAATATRDGFVKLRDLYEKYEWDAQKLAAAASTDPEVEAAFSDTSMQAASDELTSYVSQVCGIDTED